MDIKELKELVKMITETDITEFKLKTNEEKIVIRRGSKPDIQMSAPAAYSASQPISSAVPAVTAVVSPTVADEAGEKISSPIVGTFYSSPSPASPAYAQVGQVVEKGQPLCIVEAMKLMNEIEAEFRCKIVKVCKENAQAVEYGDTLFVVERL